MIQRKTALAVCAALALATLAACQSTPMPPGTAQAMIESKSGSQVKGKVTFKSASDGVWVVAEVQGLTPNSEHGFHVHENGDCSSPDAMSAGEHFNPMGAPHGPLSGPHHAGDMPNLRADAAGNAAYRALIAGMTIDGPEGIFNRAVVVHRDADDYSSQPAGNSGPRIGCGVIQR